MSAASHKSKAEPLLPIDKAAERPLWVVLIIMAFLAALALLSARMGDRNYSALQSELAGTATLQLKGLTPNNRLDIAQQALSLIETTAPNVNAQRVNDADAAALIEPWIGSNVNNLPSGITLPVLISLSNSTASEREALARAFNAAAISAVIDDHSEWSSDLTRASRAFTIGSYLILGLTFFAGTAATIFSVQSAMSAQSKTIAVFAQVGTADNFIARLFIVRAIKVGAAAAIIGALGALLFLALFRVLRGPSENGLLPSLTPTLFDIVMLGALCLVFALVCAVAAGVSAKQILSRSRLYT